MIRSKREKCLGLWIFAAVAWVTLAPGSAIAADGDACVETAAYQQSACEAEAEDDSFVARAICTNGSEDEEDACIALALADGRAARRECRQQLAARKRLCGALGGSRYDPDFDPAHFDDDFSDLTNPNPYFPLGIGYRWEYAGGGETVVVEVRDETKLIEGVTCIVVNDRVEIDGELVEDTDDWFGQRKNGDVVYCGEQVKDYETFAGDDPEKPELVKIDGSFKAGRDGALPGTQFLVSPQVDDVYRQEWSPGNAEDAAQVLSTSYGFGSDPEFDEFVPEGLAALLCNGDCVVTNEFSPIEPGAFARKYYAAGIGLFLQVHPDSGEVVALVGCSADLDPRCNSLPLP